MSQDKIRRALAGEITIDNLSDAAIREFFALLGHTSCRGKSRRGGQQGEQEDGGPGGTRHG